MLSAQPRPCLLPTSDPSRAVDREETHSLRSFGCKVFSPVDKGMRGGKLGEVRKEGVLVGYSDESPSYRVWDPVKGKVLNVVGADFDEEVEPGWWKKIGEVGATLK